MLVRIIIDVFQNSVSMSCKLYIYLQALCYPVRNLHKICPSQETCTILARVVFLVGVFEENRDSYSG